MANEYKNLSRDILLDMNIFELRDMARELGVKSPSVMRKEELVEETLKVINGETAPVTRTNRGRPPKSITKTAGIVEILTGGGDSEAVEKPPQNLQARESQPKFEPDEEGFLPGELSEREGVLEIHMDGYGFLRMNNYEQSDNDAYISNPQIRKFCLRRGDLVKGKVRRVPNNRFDPVIKVIAVNGIPAEQFTGRKPFEDLVPIYPIDRIKLEMHSSQNDIAIRCIDLLSPIGKGQRAMIVSPPKAGKTTLLKKIAHSIAKNHPDIHLIVLLIDERPEEVTDMQRSIKGEVVYSTFDETPEHHTRVAELVLARAKRLVEMGRDVVIVLDSLTRLARAYNLTVPPTGRTLSGGIDPGALYSPKRFFGSARNIEHGGSMTIIATALIDTGSRMDDVIYEEFKGTGNMEVHLDRNLSEKRIFPAIDLYRSGTRKEELLLSQKELEATYSIRKLLSRGDSQEATEQLLSLMVKTRDNARFLDMLSEVLAVYEKGSAAVMTGTTRKIFN